MNRVIRGLWIGHELSYMEQLSIASFLAHGHEYHLYAYGEVTGVPRGATVRDASAILPESSVFHYRDRPSYAGFANYFRYKLLLERGGWWADTDVVCLKPLAWSEPYVFSTEAGLDGPVVSSCIFKVPPSCDLMAEAWRRCQARDPRTLVWGETGPRLMTELVRRFGLEHHQQAEATFTPLAPLRCLDVLDPNVVWELGETTHAIHLWNERWRRSGKDKNTSYHPDCLYESLKSRYLAPYGREESSLGLGNSP